MYDRFCECTAGWEYCSIWVGFRLTLCERKTKVINVFMFGRITVEEMWDSGIRGKKERRNGEKNNKRRANYHNKRKKSVWCLAGLWNLSCLRPFTTGSILVHCCSYVAYMILASVGTQDCNSCFHFKDGNIWKCRHFRLIRDAILRTFLNRDCCIFRGKIAPESDRQRGGRNCNVQLQRSFVAQGSEKEHFSN